MFENRAPGRYVRRAVPSVNETALLLVSLLTVHYVVVATEASIAWLVAAHLVLYVGTVGLLTHRLRGQSDPPWTTVLLPVGVVGSVSLLTIFANESIYALIVGLTAPYVGVVAWIAYRLRGQSDPPWTTALGVALLPVGVVGYILTVASPSRGPLLVVLLGCALWLRVADDTERDLGRAASAVAVVGLGVTLAAFYPYAEACISEGTGLDVSVRLVATSFYGLVFGVETPALAFSRPCFSLTVPLLPALVGLSAYSLGRRAMPE